PTLSPRLNVEAFLAQARAYDQMDHELSTLLKSVRTAELTHPLPVLRAREIDRWANDATYQDLLNTQKTEIGWRNW
ncbi:MAG: peptidase M48, partial [Cyanobacteria bacterium P01_A01_bin.17]